MEIQSERLKEIYGLVAVDFVCLFEMYKSSESLIKNDYLTAESVEFLLNHEDIVKIRALLLNGVATGLRNANFKVKSVKNGFGIFFNIDFFD